MPTPPDTGLRKLGLIGGTGPESTVIYYQRLIAAIQERAGEQSVAPMIIENLSAFEVFRFLGADDEQGLLDYLLDGVLNLQAGGAEVAALTANTPHIVFDRLSKLSPLPLISSVESTVRSVTAGGFASVALLGTEFTMVNDFLSRPLVDAGVHVAVPAAEEMDVIQSHIAEELEHGVVTEEARRAFGEIVRRLVTEEGVELVILGCTELPLLFDTMEIGVPTLNTIDPHVADLVDAVTGQ